MRLELKRKRKMVEKRKRRKSNWFEEFWERE